MGIVLTFYININIATAKIYLFKRKEQKCLVVKFQGKELNALNKYFPCKITLLWFWAIWLVEKFTRPNQLNA